MKEKKQRKQKTESEFISVTQSDGKLNLLSTQ